MHNTFQKKYIQRKRFKSSQFVFRVVYLLEVYYYLDNFSGTKYSPDCNIKDVAAHGGGHGHVTESFPGHDHTGDEVGDRRPGCQEC